MRSEITEAVWMNEHYRVSLSGLLEQSGLSNAELHVLIECGVLAPGNADAAEPERSFDARCLAAARTAARLRDDFELDINGVALALSLLERIRALERSLEDIRAQLPRQFGIRESDPGRTDRTV